MDMDRHLKAFASQRTERPRGLTFSAGIFWWLHEARTEVPTSVSYLMRLSLIGRSREDWASFHMATVGVALGQVALQANLDEVRQQLPEPET